MGFIIDSAREAIRLPEKNMEPAPEIIAGKIGTGYVLGVGRMEDRLLLLLYIKQDTWQ